MSKENTDLNFNASKLQGFKSIACTFSEIEEKTADFTMPQHRGSVTCMFKDSSIKMITHGGREFMVPFNQEVEAIHPIHDGIIIQSKFNSDRCQYSAKDSSDMLGEEKSRSFFTLTKHPLNDVQPLGNVVQTEYGEQVQSLIDCQKTLLFCSPQLPFVVMHDSQSKKLEFLLLENAQPTENDSDYFASLMPDSRHSLLHLPSSRSELVVSQIWSIISTSCPSSVFCSPCFINPFQIVFQVFYKGDRQLAMIKADIRNPHQTFKVDHVIKDALEVRQIQGKKNLIEAKDCGLLVEKWVGQAKDLPENIKKLLVSLMTTEAPQLAIIKENSAIIYKGMHQVAQLEQKQHQLSNFEALLQDYNQRVCNRIESDYLARALVKICKTILPQETFVGLYKDFLQQMMSSEDQKGSKSPFEEVAEAILSQICPGQKVKSVAPPKSTARKTKEASESPTKGRSLRAATLRGSVTQKQTLTRKSELNPTIEEMAPRTSSDWLQEVIGDKVHQEFCDDELRDLIGDDLMEEIGAAFQVPEKSTSVLKKAKTTTIKDKVIQSERPSLKTGPSKAFEITAKTPRRKEGQKSHISNPTELLMHVPDLFYSLHYLYEDMKLDRFRFANEGKTLAQFLIKWILAVNQFSGDQAQSLIFEESWSNLSKVGFVQHYLNDFPVLCKQFQDQLKSSFGEGNEIWFNLLTQFVNLEQVPSILSCFRESRHVVSSPFRVFFVDSLKILATFNKIQSIQNRTSPPFEVVRQTLQETSVFVQDGSLFAKAHFQDNQSSKMEQIRHLLKLSSDNLAQVDQALPDKSVFSGPLQESELERAVVEQMLDLGVTQKFIKALPHQLSESILKLLKSCRQNLKGGDNVAGGHAFYELIGRQDLVSNKVAQSVQASDENAIMNFDPDHATQNQPSKQDVFSNKLSMEQNQLSHQQFLLQKLNKDSSYKEVTHMLNSSKEMTLNVKNIQGFDKLTEEKQKEQESALLDKNFLRHLSKMIGRGALYVGTSDTIQIERILAPKINTSCYVPATEKRIEVDIKDDIKKQLLQWPQFHNGAASALRIVMSLQSQRQNDPNFIRNWVMQHRPATPTAENAGFMLTLGLFGMLDSLKKTDMYQHLKSIHDLTAIGVLLGKAASKIGTMDQQDTNTLCMHISSLVPPSLFVDISLPVQSTAIIGTGLLYKGTSFRQITEFLISQIGRKPINDKAIEREVYALSSGMALGIVNLGVAGEMQSMFGDLKIEERLIRFIEGGKIMLMPKSSVNSQFNHENQQCSSIKEGDQVNVHITSSGALYALCFIYLQSNNQEIVNQITLPDSFHQLEYVIPQFLLQKVLCRNLILWDSIEPSMDWVESQVPELIKFIFENDNEKVEKKYSKQIGQERVDYACVSLSYINILTGSFLSLGFKFAGTGREDAFNLIYDFANRIKKMKVAKQQTPELLLQIYTNLNKNFIDKQTQENCLCMCIIAMSLIMAGTGNVKCFRMIRVIRKRIETEMHYGHQMAVNMALGFLFMGSGQFNISRSKFSIASLMCALYPIWPRDPNDNRFHLQAIRHFWVLAIETNLVQARDIDTGEFIQTDVTLKTKEGSTQRTQTPVQVNENVESIEVSHNFYYPLSLRVKNGKIVQSGNEKGNETTGKQGQVIYLKKKNIHEVLQSDEPKELDAQAVQALSHQEIPSYIYQSEKAIKDQLSEIQKVLENHQGLSCEVLNQKLPRALQTLQRMSKSSRLHQHFGHMQRESHRPSLQRFLLRGIKGLQPNLPTHSYFIHQDLNEWCQHLFLKHHLPRLYAIKVKLNIAVFDALSQDSMQLLPLKIDRIVKAQEQQQIGYDALSRDIRSCGLRWRGKVEEGCPSSSEIQAVYMLTKHFLDTLRKQGETELVSHFIRDLTSKDGLPGASSSGNTAFDEIYKSLISLVSQVCSQNSSDKVHHTILKSLLEMMK